jgi:ABC-type glycerol-3-phosphate transport system substrate-binding protein
MRKIAVLLFVGLLVIGGTAIAADKVVNVMHGWPGEQAPVFQMIVDAFEAQNPDIDVQVEIVGRDRPAIFDEGVGRCRPDRRSDWTGQYFRHQPGARSDR